MRTAPWSGALPASTAVAPGVRDLHCLVSISVEEEPVPDIHPGVLAGLLVEPVLPGVRLGAVLTLP